MWCRAAFSSLRNPKETQLMPSTVGGKLIIDAKYCNIATWGK